MSERVAALGTRGDARGEAFAIARDDHVDAGSSSCFMDDRILKVVERRLQGTLRHVGADVGYRKKFKEIADQVSCTSAAVARREFVVPKRRRG